MKERSSGWRSAPTPLLAGLLLPGLLALTACAGGPERVNVPVKVTLEIPASISMSCPRSPRPVLPPTGTLDAPQPVAGDGAVDASKVGPLWDAYVARGLWILKLSQFSVEQEGDVAACDARRDAAVVMLGAATARPEPVEP